MINDQAKRDNTFWPRPDFFYRNVYLIDVSLSNLTNVSPFEMYQEVVHSINEMVEKITIYTMTADTLGSYKLVLNKQNLERNVVSGRVNN